MTGQEVTMQSVPHGYLDRLTGQHKEMVFSVIRKKTACSLIFFKPQQSGEDAGRDYNVSRQYKK